MKKSLVITAAFMMLCITAKGSLDGKMVKYDNFLVNRNINSNNSQNFWPFYTVHLIVNIIDIKGKVINNEYCYGEPGTYTGLSQFYDPTGYELVGAIDNGVKLAKIQAQNLIVPEFLGNSSETIDYIVKPVERKSKDEPSKSKGDSSKKNENKSTNTKQSNKPNVKNDTSNNEANKTKINKNNVYKNDKADNKINNREIKKKSSNTKSIINSKGKEDENKNNNQIKKDNSTLHNNNDINNPQSQVVKTNFDLNGITNVDKTNKYDEYRNEYKSEPAKLVKPKLKRITKIISENNQQINSSITINKSLIPHSLKDTKKIVAKNFTQNLKNSTKKDLVIKKSSNLEVSNITQVLVDKDGKKHNDFKGKNNLSSNTEKHKSSEKHMFKFEVPVVNMCITEDSNDIPNSKIQHTDVDKRLSFSINSKYIKSKGLLIVTALIGIISALSLAIKPKK